MSRCTARLHRNARFAVASQEVEPGLGWAYTGFLKTLSSNPQVSGLSWPPDRKELYCGRPAHFDDQARADFLRQGSPLGGLFGFNDVNFG